MTATTASQVPELNQILASAQLPALPQSAIRLLDVSKDQENGPAEFAVPIEADPGLTGQVLKFVNSSYFGFSREISSVKLSITLVGIRTIKNFALWTAVFSLMPNPRCGTFNLGKLWQDSLRRALFARQVSNLLGAKDAEDAFAGALLQDMAVPLLVKQFTDVYARLLEERDGGKARLSDLERQHFGWTHAEVGGLLARRWNLPDVTAQFIERHAAIDPLTCTTEACLAEVAVALSSRLPAACDEQWTECRQFAAAFTRLCPASATSLPEVLGRVDTEFTDFAPVMKVSAAPKTLVESYRESSVLLD